MLLDAFVAAEERGAAADCRPALDRLRVRVKCVCLGLEALFLDPSLDRIDLARHLGSVASASAVLSGGTSGWRGPGAPFWFDPERAVIAGLALGELVASVAESSATLRMSPDGDAELHISSRVGDFGAAAADFAKELTEKQLEGRCFMEPGSVRLVFPVR